MSTQKVITITVDPATGVADYASEGFVGPHCTEPAAAWARSILETPLSEEKTAEFDQVVTGQRQHHVQRRR